MDLEIEVTSAAEAPEIEVTSAAEAPEIEVTSAAADLEFEVTSAAEGPEVGRPSAAEGPEVGGTSAAEVPEIEVISAAEGPEVGGTSSAEGPVVRKYWEYDSTSSSDSIFRAPAHMRYGRESDFEPKLVCIGPYHRGRQNLQPMEDKKVWCMSNLLMMRPGDQNKGEDLVPVEPFMKFESRARSYYKEKFDQINADEFVRMLLLDSCFIIRILLSFSGEIPESMGSVEVNVKGVRSDLLLLENQIPLFFLNVVYDWLFPNAQRPLLLIDVLLWFIRRDLPWRSSLNCRKFESDHLLDLYWKSSVPDTEQLINEMKSHKRQQTPSWEHPDSSTKLIPNATELNQIAGIEFKSDYSDGVQVEFSNGIMRMHCLKIDSTLETLLVNLIAFENSIPSSLQIISTYIKILDDLIDLEKDVELLQKFGVIFNTLSTHTKAATCFNDIGNLCLIDSYHNPFRILFENVEKYYKSSWNRRWASLQNNYFNSPWAGISVFAGVILLILTVLATFYTIYAYYKPRH